MAWERRSGSTRRYYFRAERIDGRIVKQYVGRSGNPAVRTVARSDALTKAERRASVARARAEQERYRAAAARLAAVRNQTDAVIRAACVLAARPIPRPVRPPRRPKTETNTMLKPPLAPALPTREEIDALTARATGGDTDAAAELRELLKPHTHIWRSIADLSGWAEATFIDLIADGHPLLAESLRLKCDQLRRELAQPADGQLERMVIDRIIAGWLGVEHQQIAAQQPLERGTDARLRQESLSRAQRQYFEAVRLLAELRSSD